MIGFYSRNCVVSFVLALLVSMSSGCGVMSHNQNLTGVSYFQQGNYFAADQAFRQALQNDPTNADSYYNLAAMYHQVGKTQSRPSDLQQAESYYQQCLTRDPNHADAYRGLAVLLNEQNRSGDAVALLQRWAQFTPGNAEPFVELAMLSEGQGDKNRAEQYLLDAIRMQPNNAQALASLGQLRESAGDYQQAMLNYQRSLAANQNQPQVVQRVALLQSRMPQNAGPAYPNMNVPNTMTGPNDGRWATQPQPGWSR
jgi:tetratricopeptide (TPR) repeat protein